jgi:hypothetical protein
MSNNYEYSLDRRIQNLMGNNGYCSEDEDDNNTNVSSSNTVYRRHTGPDDISYYQDDEIYSDEDNEDNEEPVSFEIDRTPESDDLANHSTTCAGCIEDQPGQMAHMGQGGCMDQAVEEFEISYADNNDATDYEYGVPPELVRENSCKCYCYQCRLENLSDDEEDEDEPDVFSDDVKEIQMCSANNQFYSYDGELYTSTFPEEWARNHLPCTGPKECEECRKVGGWNGVFIAYCVPCARKYDSERGTGFDSVGHDLHSNASNSATNTYLSGIDWNDIGDKDIYDSYESSLKHVIRSGDGQDYYIHNRELYAANFPSQYAHEHIPGTGPADCSNCYYYGSYNGIFQGYCGNCVQEYENQGSGGIRFDNDGKTGFYTDETIPPGFIVKISYVNDANGYNGDYHGDVNVKDGSRTGQGTMIFSDGSHYHGFWLNGLPHGQGRIVEGCIDSNEPCIYEGHFENGKRTYGKIISHGETYAYVNIVNGHDTFTPKPRRDFSMFL